MNILRILAPPTRTPRSWGKNIRKGKKAHCAAILSMCPSEKLERKTLAGLSVSEKPTFFRQPLRKGRKRMKATRNFQYT